MAINVETNVAADAEPNHTVQQRKRHQLQGGYECIFVEEPPDSVQTECSICLCVLREPYLLSCCGNSFCESCLKPIVSDNKPCPLCAVQFSNYMPDKRLQRTLNDLLVYCSHKEEGCDWMGQLAHLAQHLNDKPYHEGKRLLGCQLTSIECQHCDVRFHRQELVNHETKECGQRPYNCEYCRNCQSTYEDVTSKHWPDCPDRPVPCPNRCGSSPELKLLEEHYKECPLEEIECAFNYAGCSAKLSRKDMSEHISKSLANHMSLQAIDYNNEVSKLKQRISELEMQLSKATKSQEKNMHEVTELSKKNKLQLKKALQDCKVQGVDQDRRLKDHVCTLRTEIETAKIETKEEITKQVNSTKQEITKRVNSDIASIHNDLRDTKKVQVKTEKEITQQVKSDIAAVHSCIEEVKTALAQKEDEIYKQVKPDIAAIHSHTGLVPYNVTMTCVEQSKRTKKQWYSPPFYTHPKGYKMRLCVDANGCGAGENSHVSVYVHMMKGKYDEYLEWPFRGDLTLQLLNQMDDKEGSTVEVIRITDADKVGGISLVLGQQYHRPSPWGCAKFIPHTNLHFLKDDCLKLCVKKVIVKSMTSHNRNTLWFCHESVVYVIIVIVISCLLSLFINKLLLS